MISSRTRIEILSGCLVLIGLGLMLYKVLALGFPLIPGEYRDVWTIEGKVSFTPGEGPVEVELKLPQGQAGWEVLDEHFASSGFGFGIREDGDKRWAVWTRSALEQPTTLYYKVQAYRLSNQALEDKSARPAVEPMLEKDQAVAVDRLIEVLSAKSSSPERFTALLIQSLLPGSTDPDAEFLLSTWEEEPHKVILAVLGRAGIPAYEIRGILLEDGRRRQTLSALVEIHNGKEWVVFDPVTAQSGLPADFFIWQRRGQEVLSVVGARDSRLEFALVSNSLPARTVAVMEEQAEQFALLDFSIYSLPVEQQGVFKGLLLIPVAALVVVIMRLLVGVSTSGTFMPILIALAFMQTTLWLGLAIFLGLVSAGLVIRSWLSHMNLLLVSRISAVVIVVIFLMAALAIASYRLGLDQVLSVTYFPTIILAWTIERMSILWEEEGPHEVLVQGGGSLLVAVLAYAAMSSKLVGHLTFNFPELTLSLLGVILLLGKYTGYRLSELYRFRNLGRSQ
ncbi:inactive transglutaminase family protein [Pseudohalioglobus lutimaris]|uniref:inactive transglutaminase family protein n=1 Tax=Pseudohalioglobus lutimaris TaxID=1737061 RepID=UPI0018DCEAAE|nr:inactive transglutaminase family protein [Pseudohalioglobus lutimaris]